MTTNGRRVLAALACSLALACQCGPQPMPDAGVSGGGATGGGVAGGAGGGAGGGLVVCVTPMDAGSLPLEQLCDALLVGLERKAFADLTTCGEPVEARDVPFLSGLSAGDCAPDGGFIPASLARLAQKLDAGLMAYDPAQAAACRALGRALGPAAAANCAASPCERVFVGLVDAGGACEDSEDCSGALFCQPTGAATCAGRCVPRLRPGAACNPDRDLCERGSPCKETDGGFQCFVRGGVGATCAETKQCEAGLGCAGRLCVVRQAVGGPCTAHDGCQPGLGCVRNGASSTCQPRAAMGETCDSSGVGAPPCVESECIKCVGRRCIVGGVQSAACATESDCRDSFFCGDAGTCVFRARRGEPCQTAIPGERGSCLYPADFCRVLTPGNPGVCTQRPAVGEACGTTPDLTTLCSGNDTYCRYTAGQPGVCADAPRPTEPCGTAPGLSRSCAQGRCNLDAGVCEAPTGPGTPCSPNASNCRADLFCDGSAASPVCAAKKPIGEPCAGDEQCVEALCDRTTARCSIPCSTTFDNEGASCRSGCPNGLRDASGLLLFALAAGPLSRRRRTRGADDDAEARER